MSNPTDSQREHPYDSTVALRRNALELSRSGSRVDFRPVPFARTQLWRAVGGLTLLYYWRFWFLYHPTPAGILGTDYQGVEFFDFGVMQRD